MKKLHLTILLAVFTGVAFCQDAQRSNISVMGYAQKTVYPKMYRVRFLLQEEIKSQSSKGAVKTSLDSIKQQFFENMKAYGISEKDLAVIKKSSQAGYGGTGAQTLYNIVYELKNQKFADAEKFVDNLRFIGLKGVVATPVYPIIAKPVQDSLYTAAIDDARANATSMSKQVNKTIGEVISINGGYNTLRDFNIDYPNNDLYNLTRFDIGTTDIKFLQISVTISYELKPAK